MQEPDRRLRNVGRPPGQSTAELRRCPHHGVVAFHFYKGSGRWRCKRCVGEAVTRRHRKVRAILLGEAGGRCALCGYGGCTLNLHFHHVDPATKSFPVNAMRGKGLEALRAEARKCVLLCANCHGEVEAGVVRSPTPGARYADRATAV
ncbi:MAG: hypothetical protein ACJ77G_20800 [Solirubrobacteraceae bacterium]